MPFSFRRRAREEDVAPPVEAPAPVDTRVAFDGLSEDWRLRGRMNVEGRLSDVLNRRDAIPLSEMSWAPIDGSESFSDAPGLKSVDPYDLIIVLAGEGTLPPLSNEEKAAHKVHKVGYDVALEVPPYRVVGTIYLYPGTDPDRLMERATEMFIPVTDASAYLGEQQLNDPAVDTILVNRFYLRGVQQVDKRTGARAVPFPGGPLGGTA